MAQGAEAVRLACQMSLTMMRAYHVGIGSGYSAAAWKVGLLLGGQFEMVSHPAKARSARKGSNRFM